jgi:hypothetical protein
MKKNLVLTLVIGLMVIIPFIYLLVVYDALPPTVPTHFRIDGKPDAMSDKSTLWFVLSLTGGISVLVFLLLRFLPAIDPKRKAQYSASVFVKIGLAVVLLISIINCVVINSAEKGSFSFQQILPALLGIFFAFMGNIMHSLKPNYFAGIRTPWTLESEETWRKTHQLAGKLWFIGGITIFAIAILVPSSISLIIMIGILIAITIVPIVYSYKHFKSTQKV